MYEITLSVTPLCNPAGPDVARVRMSAVVCGKEFAALQEIDLARLAGWPDFLHHALRDQCERLERAVREAQDGTAQALFDALTADLKEACR